MVSVTDDENSSLAAWRETAIPIALGAVLLSVFTMLMAVYLIGKLHSKQELTMALNAADERYQHTVNSVMDAIVAVDEQMNITMFNPSAEAMFGLEASKAMGQSLEILMPERLRAVHKVHTEVFSSSQTASRSMAPQMEIFGMRSDGTEFPLESTISHTLIGGKMQMTAVLRDVTERRKVETELRMANSQLRELSVSLQSVREEERKRISRELHDDLGQQLTGLKLSLSWLGSRLKEGKATAVDDVDEMRRQMDSAIGSVRRIAAELRPRVLDDLDFAEALSWQTQEFFKHSGIQIKLDLPDAGRVRDDAIATTLFRIVQEALTNVVRHAHAEKVLVSLHYSDGYLNLLISDTGRGFDTSAAAGGVGVVSMRERCSAIGAGFRITSTPGFGTRVEVSV
jgi:PAS domain S-box-containing protein